MNNEELWTMVKSYSHQELIQIIAEVYWFDISFVNALSGLSLQNLQELVFDIIKFKD